MMVARVILHKKRRRLKKKKKQQHSWPEVIQNCILNQLKVYPKSRIRYMVLAS